MLKYDTISRRDASESVSTRRARRLDHRVSVRRLKPSFQRNHSGWATNEMSCTVNTMGMFKRSGAV
jgi:hypothetical protein